jgi:hypothetical protein
VSLSGKTGSQILVYPYLKCVALTFLTAPNRLPHTRLKDSFFRPRPGDFIQIFATSDCGNTFTGSNCIFSPDQVVTGGFLIPATLLDAFNSYVISFKIAVRLIPGGFTGNFLNIVRFVI